MAVTRNTHHKGSLTIVVLEGMNFVLITLGHPSNGIASRTGSVVRAITSPVNTLREVASLLASYHAK